LIIESSLKGTIHFALSCSSIKACLLAGFIFFFYLPSPGQNKKLADSLERIYQSGTYTKEEKLSLLKDLSANQTDYEKKLTYSEELIAAAEALDSANYMIDGYLEKGNALRLMGDLTKALESLFKGSDIAAREGLNDRVGTIYVAIADVYSIYGNHKNSVDYYHRSIEILKNEKDTVNLASALLNAGEEYFNYNDMDSATFYYEAAGKIFNDIHYELGVAYYLGNMGRVHAKSGDWDLAEDNINEAVNLLTAIGDYYPICVYLTDMANIYEEKGNRSTALRYLERSLQLAMKYGLKEQIRDANLKLSEYYDKSGMSEKALGYYRQYVVYRDSLNNLETVQKMADLRTNYEISQKQTQVDLLEQQKSNQRIVIIATLVATVLIILLAFVMYHRYEYAKKTNKIITDEKARSENLLLNILPEEIARELKARGKVQARKFDNVTVLFSDFKDFTRLAHEVEPELLVKSVDFYFRKFDEITTRHGLEKIKTIGDSYMCAGGIPLESDTHAEKVAMAAREMNQFILDQLQSSNDLLHFNIRIGIHTGPVVAGIVGTRKWQYDIWGDTVNIASRMESNSEAGRVNLSETTYQLIKDKFTCSYRGEIEAKNWGKLKMYYLE